MSLITQLTSLATAVGNAVKLRMLKSANLTDVADRQAALNGLTNSTAATGEQVLTKDTATGNVVFKTPAAGGSSITVQVISANTTAVKNKLYVLSASLTLTLPASPIEADSVWVSNLSGTTTGTIARNGSKIMGLAEDLTIDKANAGIQLVYTNATYGWVII